MCVDVIRPNTFRRSIMSQRVVRAEHLASEEAGATAPCSPRCPAEVAERTSRLFDAGLADAMLRLALRGLANRAASDIAATPRAARAQAWLAVT